MKKSNKHNRRLLVMAGGTGGHVFPGLAVAHHLMEQGWQVRWLGTADRMEAQLIPQQGIAIDFIRISGIRGKGLVALLLAPVRILWAIWQAWQTIRRYRPDVVLGMGGYVSGPGGIAAWLSRVPLVVHEQNGIAGLTNRGLKKIASQVLQAFPGAIPTATVVGNPIRGDLLAMAGPKTRFADREGPIRVLVTGGSQGAQVLNQVMPQVVQQLGGRITLWHQAGKGAAERVSKAYQQVGQGQHRIDEFITDMAQAYEWADVVICRAGALTVSEIMAVGIAAIFIPFMHKDRQQYWNALPLQQAQAAEILEQPQLSADRICTLLQQWDRPELLAMAERGRALAVVDSTERVANIIIACCNGRQNKEETMTE